MVRDLLFIGSMIFLHLLISDIVRSEKTHVDSAKACESLRCSPGEHCVSRKFWCKNPPCPAMLYCSKTQRESIRGPITCASVRCSKGYICMVKEKRCRWDQRCKQQIARCVSDRKYYERPDSCVDFHCPSGHRCILRESPCHHPPCKLLKSCANIEDVQLWHDRCRTLGCPSEYECFLRGPSGNCASTNSCKYNPDCTVTDVTDLSVNPECQGWVCPRDQKCSAVVPESCSTDDGCRVNRTCHGPLATLDSTSSPSARLNPQMPTSNYEPSVIPNARSYPLEYNHRPSHPTKQTTGSIPEAGNVPIPSQTDCNLNKRTVRVNWDMQFEKLNSRNGPIYRAPVYVRFTSNRSSSEVAGESVSQVRPTDQSITRWLDHLRLKTGVDAINVWIKEAEENRKDGQFSEWLAAVRSNLGPFRFDSWLREIRKLTSGYPAFQKWLVTNEAVPSSAENNTNKGNGTEQKTFAVFSDQQQKPEVDSKHSNETTEGPVRGYGTLTDFYPRVMSINDRLLFSVDHGTPDLPLRKNAGHPRINYGGNRGHKQHREFYPLTDRKVQDIPGRMEIQTRDNTNKTKNLQKEVANNSGQDYSVNQSHQPDFRNDTDVPSLDNPTVESPIQKNTSARNDLKFDSVEKPEKSIWDVLRVQNKAEKDDFERRLSNVDVGRKEEHQDLIKENESGQGGSGFDKLMPETRDQIGNHNGLDHDVLFTKVEDPKWNSGPQRTPAVSTVSRRFTVEDQREPSAALEFPESIYRQYYQRVYELDHKPLESLAKSRNSSSDVETKKDKNFEKTYTSSSTPTPEELHITSPWDPVQVPNPEQAAYYSLVGLAPEQDSNRLRLIGYPLLVSRVSSIDQADISPQDPKDLSDISPHSDLNPWVQIFHHQTIPHNSDPSTLGERKDLNDPGGEQRSKHEGQNSRQSFSDSLKSRPISGADKNLYLSDGRTRLRLPEISRVSELPIRPHSTGFVDLDKSFKEYHDFMSSQEYADAYVNALIKDALSKVILDQQLRDYQSPSQFSQDIQTGINDRFDNTNLGTVKETQHPDKNVFKDEKHYGDPNVSDILQAIQPTRDILTNKNQKKTTSYEYSSTDLDIGDIDYQYGCEDDDSNLSGVMEAEEEIPTLDEVVEYYYGDTGQQEYFEGPLRYPEEYLEELSANLTDYDFQYYGDEEDKVLPEKLE